MALQIFYCGCWKRAGHYVFAPGMRRLQPPANVWGAGPWEHLDTRKLNPYGGRQGQARLTHLDGWTALGIVDNTVDRRPASHATFAIEGTFSFDEAVALAHEHFPEVMARVGSCEQVAVNA